MNNATLLRELKNLSAAPWALAPTYSDTVAQTATELAAGKRPSILASGARSENPIRFVNGKAGTTAVVSFQGLVTYALEYQPYLVSTRQFAATMAALTADPKIDTIAVLFDSPGGTVVGLPEAAAALAKASQLKPTVAIVDTLCASAAYYVASQASLIYCMPSGIGVGSIGVRVMHLDFSRQLEQSGIAVTQIYSAPFKVEGNPYQPLSEEARARFQYECDTLYSQFVNAVARGRGVDAKTVRDTFGQGRVLMPAEAKRVGMVDILATPQEAIARISTRKAEPRGSAIGSAEIEREKLRLALIASR